jgi:leucine dehydrogenase
MQEAASLQELLEHWDGLGVVSHFDRPTGSWIFIALHDDTLGRPTGGTRMRSYDNPAAGLLDAQRLAEGMTHKWAAAGVPYGGGKAVLAVPAGLAAEDRRALLHRYGALVESLQGAFATGEDLGTTPQDMTEIAAVTRWVLGGHGGDGLLADPGPFTAHGVLAALRATAERAFGSAGLEERRILVQGVGDVGVPLARQLAAAGAHLLLSDSDAGRATALADELRAAGAEVDLVPADAVYDARCDVFAPCAVGAVLNANTIPRLTCRAVAGSANNQLADAADADLLHRHGIVYAPDYVTNAGGAIAFAHLADHPEAASDELMARVEVIGEVTAEILAEAAESDESPLHAAHRRVERMLAAKRNR